MSVDGFVAGPGGEIDWLLRGLDESTILWIQETLWQAGVHIMGSRTFNDMIHYWPSATDPLAKPMNEIPKIVFSQKGNLAQSFSQTTAALKDAIHADSTKGAQHVVPDYTNWLNASVVSGDLATEILKLKRQEGKSIMAHGGASFAQSLVRTGLIDEYQLLVHPIILGQGLPLFSGAAVPVELKLVSSTLLKSGALANIYSTGNN